MDADTRIVYEALKGVAKARQTIFYGDLSKLIDLRPMDSKFYRILDSISRREHGQGRPLLTALVVRRGYSISGPGFFDLARQLGKLEYFDVDAPARVTFWVDEVRRVWDYWK